MVSSFFRAVTVISSVTLGFFSSSAVFFSSFFGGSCAESGMPGLAIVRKATHRTDLARSLFISSSAFRLDLPDSVQTLHALQPSGSPTVHNGEVKLSKKKKLILLIGAAALILITLGSMVASRKREKPTLVTTDKAFQKTITQLVTATGKIQPEVEVKIAPEVSGELIEIPVKEGQLVHRGQLLLKIKPDVYQAQVEAQQAALNSSRSAAVRNRAEVEKA